MPEIRSSSDLRNSYPEISKLAKEERRPVFITVNGKGDTVLLSMADYEQMQAEMEELKLIAESDEAIRERHVKDADEVYGSLLGELNALKGKA